MKENLFFRTLTVDRSAVDKESRTARLSFSSEHPVQRWFGDEILLHNPSNADLSRLTTVGAALYGHDHGLQGIIGPILSASIKNRRGEAVIGFDPDETGNMAIAKVESGSLRGVSFAYNIREGVKLAEGDTWTDPESGRKFDGPALIATKWEAYEISLTPVPADPSVGVGRSASRSLDGIEIRTPGDESRDLSEAEIKRLIREAIEDLRRQIPTAALLRTEALALLRAERENRPRRQVLGDEARDLIERAEAIGDEIKAAVFDMIASGRTAGDVLRAIADAAERSGVGEVSIPAATDRPRHPVIVPTENLVDLAGRAAAVSPQTKLEVIDMALAGRHETELLRHIASALDAADAADNGDGANGPGSSGTAPARPTRLSDLSDDDLAAAITRPVSWS